jgi:hypothetical protein
MPRRDRPFRPIRRILTTAIVITTVYVLGGSALDSNHEVWASVIYGAIVLVGSLGVGVLLYRKDLAALVRTRRQG